MNKISIKRNAKRTHKAFTLMEIIMVVAMLALLMSLVVGDLDGIFGSGEEKTAKMFVDSSLSTPLMRYRSDMNKYPTTEEGLLALVVSTNDDSSWKGPYLKPAKVPVDPWGNEYQYACPGEHNKNSYDVWSMGRDGTTGTADDIGNWEETSK